jgi:hypothetical protein
LKTAADQAVNWTRRFVTSAWRAPAERSGCLVRQAACMSDGRHGPREVAAAMADLFNYIEMFCNRSRRHSTLRYRSPSQFLQHWIATQQQRKLAA